MKHRLIAITVLSILPMAGAARCIAQSMDDLNLQVHGYATQGYVYSTNNNWDTTNSTDGSATWTEAVVNLSVQPQPKLRIGIQARYYLLGTYGNTISLDWAQADFKVNEKIGFRAGKVKTPSGLLNESQDIDPAQLWILLPQSIYPLSSRNDLLSHYGGVVYGTVALGETLGKMEYRAFAGERVVAPGDAYLQSLRDSGFTLPNGVTGSVFGGTLHWNAPVPGLMVGATELSQGVTPGAIAAGPYQGTFTVPKFYYPSFFGRYERNKLMVAGEYSRLAATAIIQLPGAPTVYEPSDQRLFYAMTSYKLAEKLTGGMYYSYSLDRKAMLTDAIPQQMWSTDADGNIEYCNQHLIDYIGSPMEGLVGEAFFRHLHPLDERLFRQAWRSTLDAGKKFEVETRIRGADGTYRWFLIRSVPQHSIDGKIAHWYGIHIDIEQQYRAQQGLTVAHDDLSRLSRTLSMEELTASIAHELNQPLTAVVTHAYACRKWLSAEPAHLERAVATADKIVQESTRAAAVVARVRALFRKNDTVRESTDLNLLIMDLARVLRDDAIRRNVSIKLALAPDLPQVDLDQVQIQQVLLNLAINGMDAMADASEPRELTIRSERQADNEICVTVEDRGVGLTADAPTRMFEPFFSTKPQGTGMGLAICRSIVEAHDGRIWASESAGGGAAFHLTIRVQS